ncbi:MAG: DUF2089 family protein [Desulfobacterales bacterium]|nr:DUF2089 family protein [Desulfobacterales bacterium]
METILNQNKWINQLDEEDTVFIKRFILASGSLKALAKTYGISYPTVRLRLDRLIEKIKILEANLQMSRFERELRVAYAEGRIDQATFKSLLNAYKKEMEGEENA